MESCLSCRNLTVSFRGDDNRSFRVVSDISFDVPLHGTLGIVGESGCGKSITALSILRLIPNPPGCIENGSITFENKNLLALSDKEIHAIRGNKISMIFQDPMTSLNPVMTCGSQVIEAIRLHRTTTARQARTIALDLFEKVGIPEPLRRLRCYPHELSGGMRQRVMIAMALACNPSLLIADEPTTALDVTVQARILDLLHDLQQARALSMILITHDLGIVYDAATTVLVMYAGRVMEYAPTAALFDSPLHPYTQNLLQTLPVLDAPDKRLTVIPGEVPSPQSPVTGCPFHPRCTRCMDQCKIAIPELINKTSQHQVRCFLYE